MSVTTFVLLASLVATEERYGRRLLVSSLRNQLDIVILRTTSFMSGVWHHFVRRVVTLSWYYSLHAFLKICLRFLASLYEAVEHLFINNRNKARQLRRERRQTHLTALQDHQTETTLSEAEKKRIKAKALNS